MNAEGIFWIIFAVACLQRLHVKFQKYWLRLKADELMSELYYQASLQILKEEANQ
ncbi:MAG: hypothetical protein BWY07_02004 [Candidatus Hydrogenedentes bacterium ADurb.Bin170]|nr:MAG: hypothetical protein BWY07_02004 [Candidatus Hydrogenedentes bacterium ADurb.Bin170]